MANQQKYHVLFPKQLRSKGSLIEENSARGNEKTVVIAEISNEILNCYNFPMQMPTFNKEQSLWDRGLRFIAGLAECGGNEFDILHLLLYIPIHHPRVIAGHEQRGDHQIHQ